MTRRQGSNRGDCRTVFWEHMQLAILQRYVPLSQKLCQSAMNCANGKILVGSKRGGAKDSLAKVWKMCMPKTREVWIMDSYFLPPKILNFCSKKERKKKRSKWATTMKCMDRGAEINSNFFINILSKLKKKKIQCHIFLGLLQSVYHLVGIEI